MREIRGYELDEQQHSEHSVKETWHMNGKQVESQQGESPCGNSQVWK